MVLLESEEGVVEVVLVGSLHVVEHLFVLLGTDLVHADKLYV